MRIIKPSWLAHGGKSTSFAVPLEPLEQPPPFGTLLLSVLSIYAEHQVLFQEKGRTSRSTAAMSLQTECAWRPRPEVRFGVVSSRRIDPRANLILYGRWPCTDMVRGRDPTRR